MTTPRPPLRLVGSADDEDGRDRLRAGAAPDGPDVLDADTALDDEPIDHGPPRPATMPTRAALLVGVAVQAMGTLAFADKYTSLAHAGAVSPAGPLLAVPGTLALWAGAAAVAWKPGRGRRAFLAATAALGIALPFWGIAAPWSWPLALGAMLGLAGAWIARMPAPEAVDDGADTPRRTGHVVPLHPPRDD